MTTLNKPITVKWADHHVSYGDYSLEEIKALAQPYYGEYSGLLVNEDKQTITICSNKWEDGQYSDPMVIMKRCIVSRSDKGHK